VNSEYAYRVEPTDNLVSIASGGLWCELATKQDWMKVGMKITCPGLEESLPVESGMAKIENWKIPPVSIMMAPRIYLWLCDQNAIDSSINPLTPESLAFSAALKAPARVLIRFPSRTLTSHVYPDGCFRLDTAYYCIFPDKKAKDIAVKADVIEVEFGGKWLNLSDYLLT
jgi:hypothetical protein